MSSDANNFWHDKRVVITGGSGFLGKHLVQALEKLQPKSITIIRSTEYDLTKVDDALQAMQDQDLVIHLAAKVGGIGYNREHPAELFTDNIRIGTNVIDAAYKAGVQKLVAVGTICAYPKFTPVPFKEEELWNGYPEETNAPYGLAKKMMIVQSEAYRQQYGFNSINLLPVNLYGPGDNFKEESSHVIPALIRRFVEHQEQDKPSLEVWGTGTATREFLFVQDAVRGILLAAEGYDQSDPVNLGAGAEISIKDLVAKVQQLTGYTGQIIWDHSKPDGQPRRKLDTSKAQSLFGFQSEVSFEDGLAQTIAWYREHRND